MLVDFVVELTPREEEVSSRTWKIHVDGSASKNGCGAEVVIRDLENIKIEHAIHFLFQATNNVAEYEALLVGLEIANNLGAKRVEVFNDLQLVYNQVRKLRG